jgi:signal peptidase I
MIIAALLGLAGGALILATVGAPFMLVSPSMEPTFNTGDLFWVRPVVGEIRPGMVVTYRMDGRIITHRVVAAEGGALVTQGDNNWAPDPWKVPPSAVIGTPVLRLPYLGWLIELARKSVGGASLALLLSVVLTAGEVVGLISCRRCRSPSLQTRSAAQPEEHTRAEGLAAWRSSVQGSSGRRWAASVGVGSVARRLRHVGDRKPAGRGSLFSFRGCRKP